MMDINTLQFLLEMVKETQDSDIATIKYLQHQLSLPPEHRVDPHAEDELEKMHEAVSRVVLQRGHVIFQLKQEISKDDNPQVDQSY